MINDFLHKIQMLTLNAKTASTIACGFGSGACCHGSTLVPRERSTAEPSPTHPEGVNMQTHHVSHASESFAV